MKKGHTWSNVRLLGVSYPGDVPEGYSAYFVGAGAEWGVEYSGFENWELPAREYVVCGLEAENFQQMTASALGRAMKHMRFWLREHGLIADGFFPEIYYHGSFRIAYMEMWMHIMKTACFILLHMGYQVKCSK